MAFVVKSLPTEAPISFCDTKASSFKSYFSLRALKISLTWELFNSFAFIWSSVPLTWFVTASFEYSSTILSTSVLLNISFVYLISYVISSLKLS